jgi:hypothetical protein
VKKAAIAAVNATVAAVTAAATAIVVVAIAKKINEQSLFYNRTNE